MRLRLDKCNLERFTLIMLMLFSIAVALQDPATVPAQYAPEMPPMTVFQHFRPYAVSISLSLMLLSPLLSLRIP